MMKQSILYMALAALLLPLGMQAQRRGRSTKAKVEEPVEDPRITQMRAATQQVVFIDSMVVDRADFMSHIPLSVASGRLSQRDGLGTYINEMGDHRLRATADSTIAGSDFIANRWTDEQPLEGIGEGAAGYPFLMPDGITLYYAQKGGRSIGGYDIFVTRYDASRGTFLRPENIGMPFASEADDLFFAIDEFSQLGYFVTNRRQPEGKVCIYVFIPPTSRRVYPTEAYSEEEMRALAALSSISATWGSGRERADAMQRLSEARSGAGDSPAIGSFAVTSQLDELRHQEQTISKALTLTRNYYATASDDERSQLAGEIVEGERQLEALQREIREKEKNP